MPDGSPGTGFEPGFMQQTRRAQRLYVPVNTANIHVQRTRRRAHRTFGVQENSQHLTHTGLEQQTHGLRIGHTFSATHICTLLRE